MKIPHKGPHGHERAFVNDLLHLLDKFLVLEVSEHSSCLLSFAVDSTSPSDASDLQ